MNTLRPYQEKVVEEIIDAPERRLCLVAPTGAGKTVIACEIINRCNKPVLFFGHRRELVFQYQEHLAELGVTAGIVMSGYSQDMRGVQIGSVQTIHARCVRGGADLPPAGIVFVDEAHHAPAETYRTIMRAYPEAKIIGMTAAPCRRNGRGLGGIFAQRGSILTQQKQTCVADKASARKNSNGNYFPSSWLSLTWVHENIHANTRTQARPRRAQSRRITGDHARHRGQAH
jgi:superfamily II DNA or RNA helicase